MADSHGSPHDSAADEMAELLAVFIDETAEQCEQLVQALLTLEADPTDARQIAVAFRMVHSIKGSAGMLGFDPITAVAHHLESHFDRIRAGKALIDAATVQASFGCVDYFRECTGRLAAGEPLGANAARLEAVMALGRTAESPPAVVPAAPSATRSPAGEAGPDARERRVRIRLAGGIAMPDVKVRLIVRRLAACGTIVGVQPAESDFAARPDMRLLDVVLRTAAPAASIVLAADADGVDSVDLDPAGPPLDASAGAADVEPMPIAPVPPVPAAVEPGPGDADPAGSAVAETMRVAVDRLDVLLDLAGELVVNRARFAQLVADLAPLFRSSAGRSPEWADGQRRYGDLVETVDQLTRVVENLQRGVLGTRMVPIGPLFGRFRRSVRDISLELGKTVVLELAGEQTELDKRMVDELGDPLVHLVRNAIDHGIEPASARLAAGKPEAARLRLEASHRGNEVIILIADDGRGIDVDKVRDRAVARGLVSAERAASLSPRELIDFIWQPGFSTAERVSSISGRGVGMDIVRTKIEGLNGTIDVASAGGKGTAFTIRLPLTLAISRCMLFRIGGTAFAIPVEHVLEIVTVSPDRVLTVAGRRVCDIRGEFLPLVDMRGVFTWPGGCPPAEPSAAVLVVRAAGRSAAIGVPVLLGTRDLVVKPLDDNFRRVRGLGGASVLGDGEVCLMIDAGALIDMASRGRHDEVSR